MMKRVLLLIVAMFFSIMAVEAQDYSRYNYFHDEAVRLIAQGKLVEAKVKLEAMVSVILSSSSRAATMAVSIDVANSNSPSLKSIEIISCRSLSITFRHPMI